MTTMYGKRQPPFHRPAFAHSLPLWSRSCSQNLKKPVAFIDFMQRRMLNIVLSRVRARQNETEHIFGCAFIGFHNSGNWVKQPLRKSVKVCLESNMHSVFENTDSRKISGTTRTFIIASMLHVYLNNSVHWFRHSRCYILISPDWSSDSHFM